MVIGFRVDASRELGMGHMVRCRTLAEAWKDLGSRIVFFYCNMPEWVEHDLKQNGIQCVRLNSPSDEVETLINHINKLDDDLDWLIVDSYHWDDKREKAVLPYVKHLMVIDDLANRRHDCDLLLDQNDVIGLETRYLGLLPSKTCTLLGSRYALLRREFFETRKNFQKCNSGVNTLFVSFGGSDPTNETAKVLEALDSVLFANLKIHVVIGRHHPKIEQIETICQSDPRFHLHIQTNQIAKLMAESDLAICAGGTMTWERYCLGLPGIVISIADNQIEIAKAGQKSGIDWYLGESQQVEVDQIRSTLQAAMNNPDRLRYARRLAMKKVDGLGVERVIEEMIKVGEKL